MSDWNDSLEAAGEALLTCLPRETVDYTPAGGATVARHALVRRLGTRELEPLGQIPLADFYFRNDGALGVAAATVNTGGDTIRWQPVRRGPRRTSRVVAVIHKNPGITVLRVA